MKEFKVQIGVTKSKGKGVFAAEDIDKGTVYVSDAIVFKRPPQEDSILNLYLFGGKHCKLLFANSWCSRINHDSKPNLEYHPTDDNMIEFTALRDIKQGEELTINYCYDLEATAKNHHIDIEEYNKACAGIED